MMPDPEKARLILALRRANITDDRVLAAMESIPRELFVSKPFQGRAYQDVALPIAHRQTVSRPTVVARMTEALKVGERMKVLEIGTGSGYQSAVLSPLCRRLYTIERHRELLLDAEQRFQELRLRNITTLAGDGTRGWPEQAPFERIMVTAAAADIPPVLVNQLAPGGIMVVPVGDGCDDEDRHLLRITKTEDGIHTEDLGFVRFVPLVEGVAGD